MSERYYPKCHGEMITAKGKLLQFRYDWPFELSKKEMVERIQTRFMPGCQVQWIAEGYIPEDTSKWGGWDMTDNIDPEDFVVVQLPLED